MGQAEIIEIAAAFVAGILLIGTVAWLIGKKTVFAVLVNSLLSGIIMLVLSLFKLMSLSPPVSFLSGFLGLPGLIISFFII